MGKAIVYCAVCGKSISAESILLQDAILVQDSYYCKECAQSLNIKISDKNKKVIKKPIRHKVDFSKIPDISIEKAPVRVTFFEKYKKEMTYILYLGSIFIIIFSTLYIVYRYAIYKPSLKMISEQKCDILLKEISSKDLTKEDQLQSLQHLINIIDDAENIIRGSRCEKEVFTFRANAKKRVEELTEEKNLISRMDDIKNKVSYGQIIPQVAILELRDIYNKYRHIWFNIVDAFHLVSDFVIIRLWEDLSKTIESEYQNSLLSLNDYEKEIDKFVKENNIETGDFISDATRSKIIPHILTFKSELKNKFEEAASKSRDLLVSEVASLTERGECDAAKAKILGFPEKYIGTNAYTAVKLLEEDIKQNCKAKTDDTQPSDEDEKVDEQSTTYVTQEVFPLPTVKTEDAVKIEDEKEVHSVTPPSTAPTQQVEKETEKIEIFNGKNLDNWKKINNNATWQVWHKNLYGRLLSNEKDHSILYFTKKQFKNFYISFKYKLLSGMFFVCYHISQDKPSEKFSYIYLNSYDKTDEYATFTAKVFDTISMVNAPKGKNGDVVINPSLKEGFIGFLIAPGTEIYFKDIVVEEITEAPEDIKKTISVPLFNGLDIKNWVKSGAKGEWKVVEGMIYGENNNSNKDTNTIDMSAISVLYFNDNNFKPEWTNYITSFEFKIVEDGFLVFGKFPIEGSASGTQINKRFFEIGKWYQAEVIVTPEKIVTKFSAEDITPVEQQVDTNLKGYFGFGVLPGQKVYLKNIKLQFIK